MPSPSRQQRRVAEWHFVFFASEIAPSPYLRFLEPQANVGLAWPTGIRSVAVICQCVRETLLPIAGLVYGTLVIDQLRSYFLTCSRNSPHFYWLKLLRTLALSVVPPSGFCDENCRSRVWQRYHWISTRLPSSQPYQAKAFSVCEFHAIRTEEFYIFLSEFSQAHCLPLPLC